MIDLVFEPLLRQRESDILGPSIFNHILGAKFQTNHYGVYVAVFSSGTRLFHGSALASYA